MTRGSALRLSLLGSLGLLPVMGCGGSAHSDDRDVTAGGSASQGSSAAIAGGDRGGSGGTAGARQVLGTPTCTDPVDSGHGFVTCAEGFSHRVAVFACGQGGSAGDGGAGSEQAGGAAQPTLPRASEYVACSDDPSVCDAFEHGFCRPAFLSNSAMCLSGCVTDTDCGDGAFCRCGNPLSPTGGVCVPSTCGTDQDCGSGYCASYALPCYSGDAFACRQPDDECVTFEDCAVTVSPGSSCVFDSAEQRRVCEPSPTCGRPFLVEHAARVASVESRADWLPGAALGLRLDHLSAAERDQQAAHWSRLGQLEHASIAAFARFQLQLLSLGAPCALIDESTRALADETAHTRLCFALASAYAGRPLGPGPLDVERSLAATSLSEVVELAIVEGCFGETGAALEALDAMDSASDPIVRAAYARIAADEERHAQLAFRFVRWALGHGAANVRALVSKHLEGETAQRAVFRIAGPCLRALLDEARSHEPLATAPGMALAPS